MLQSSNLLKKSMSVKTTLYPQRMMQIGTKLETMAQERTRKQQSTQFEVMNERMTQCEQRLNGQMKCTEQRCTLCLYTVLQLKDTLADAARKQSDLVKKCSMSHRYTKNEVADLQRRVTHLFSQEIKHAKEQEARLVRITQEKIDALAATITTLRKQREMHLTALQHQLTNALSFANQHLLTEMQAEQNKLNSMEQILDGEITLFRENMHRIREEKDTTFHNIMHFIKSVTEEIRKEIQEESQERESNKEQLLSLLENTCDKYVH